MQRTMKSAFDDDEEYELTAFGQHFHYALTDVPPKIEFKNPPAGAAQQGDGIMSAATHMLSVSDWLTLPEVATPPLRDEGETGAIVMVAKVRFLLATDAACKKANITAD